MTDITVYSTIASDGVIRIALHPMDCAPDAYRYGRGTGPEIKWLFRIAFMWNVKDISGWLYSCRGKDVTMHGHGKNFSGGSVIKDSMYSIYDIYDDNTDQAIQWLLEGED